MIENHMVLPYADDDAVLICPDCGEQLSDLGSCWLCSRPNELIETIKDMVSPDKVAHAIADELIRLADLNGKIK